MPNRIALLVITGVLLMMQAGYAATIIIDKAEKPQVVMKVDAKPVSIACDKYCWQDARVIEIYSTTIDQAVPKEIKIASYSWEHAAPEGISTVSLVKYRRDDNDSTMWRLLNIKNEDK